METKTDETAIRRHDLAVLIGVLSGSRVRLSYQERQALNAARAALRRP